MFTQARGRDICMFAMHTLKVHFVIFTSAISELAQALGIVRAMQILRVGVVQHHNHTMLIIIF